MKVSVGSRKLLLASTVALATGAASAETVRGRVVDAQKGLALPGAIVTVRGTDFSATTGRDGGFAIPDAPAGPQTLVVDCVGYAEGTQATTGADALVTVALAGTEAGEVVVTGNRLAERRTADQKGRAQHG